MIYTGTYKTVQITIRAGFITTSYAIVAASELAFVDMLSVKVEGESYDITQTGNPDNRLVKYASNVGMLLFQVGLGKDKSVSVIYQH